MPAFPTSEPGFTCLAAEPQGRCFSLHRFCSFLFRSGPLSLPALLPPVDSTTRKLIGAMAVFVLLGLPLVGYLWETLNELLALEADATRLLISVPVLALLGGLLWMLSKAVGRWQDTGSP